VSWADPAGERLSRVFSKPYDFRSCIRHDAHKFMSEDVAIFKSGQLASIQMQVRAAYCGSSDFQDDVIRLLEYRVGYRIDADVMASMTGKGKHRVSPSAAAPHLPRYHILAWIGGLFHRG